MNDCIFCKIINNELPSYSLYEDDKVKVFLSIDPIHNGHTLIIPKKHIKDFEDISLEELNHIYKVAKDMYKLINDKLNCIGIKFVQNNGSYQDVKHFHLHLIPAYENEEMPIEKVYEILKK